MKKLTPEQKALYDQLNTRQQKFACGIIEGKTQRQAYIDAGYADNSGTDTRAARLIGNDQVKSFIDSVLEPQQEKAAESAIASREEVLEFLTGVVRTKVTDVAEFDERSLGVDEETGEEIKQAYWRFKGSNDIDPKAAACIESVKAGKFGLEFKMVSKQAAAKQLADMMGWNAAKNVNLSGEVKSVNYTPDEYKAAQEALKSKFDDLD